MSVPAEQDHVTPPAKRVLVYRLGSLGDTLVALPCFHLVERSFPQAERRLLTNFPVASKAAAAMAVLGSSGLIHSYERYTVGLRNPLHLLALAWRIRRFRPDVLVYLAGARGAATAKRDARFFRWACGSRRMVGVPLTPELQTNLAQPDGTLEPETARLARTLCSLGDAELARRESWNLRLSAAEVQKADAALQLLEGLPFFALSIGTKVQVNEWGRENWRALLGRLARLYPDHGLVLTGAAEEREAIDWVADGWRAVQGAGPVLNVCGALQPRESAAVFQRAAVFLGHDSGPMHMAATVGTRCVAVFSARHLPRVWYPWGEGHRVIYHRVDCAGCELVACTEQRKKCILSVTVEEVLRAVAEVMAQR